MIDMIRCLTMKGFRISNEALNERCQLCSFASTRLIFSVLFYLFLEASSKFQEVDDRLIMLSREFHWNIIISEAVLPCRFSLGWKSVSVFPVDIDWCIVTSLMVARLIQLFTEAEGFTLFYANQLLSRERIEGSTCTLKLPLLFHLINSIPLRCTSTLQNPSKVTILFINDITIGKYPSSLINLIKLAFSISIRLNIIWADYVEY